MERQVEARLFCKMVTRKTYGRRVLNPTTREQTIKEEVPDLTDQDLKLFQSIGEVPNLTEFAKKYRELKDTIDQ
jgi:hypothetical protein